MSTAATAKTDGDRFVLRDVSWDRYIALRDDPTQDHVKMTYFRGVLELMSPSGPHERINRLLEHLIVTWCLVREIPVSTYGSTTYRRQKNAVGLEPDSCFYVQNAALLGGKSEIDLTVDPPPDLAVEVDLTSSSLDRLPIYAALGVPEVWRTDGDWFQIYRLAGERYQEVPHSEVFSSLPISGFLAFLRRSSEWDVTALIREFRAWAASQKPSAS